MKKVSLSLIILLVSAFPLILKGQNTLEDAINEYNKGVLSNNADSIDAAIAHFEKCIEICNQLGDEGEERRIQTEALLPTLYYNKAAKSLKEEKYDEAIPQFNKAAEIATKYGDQQTAEKANKIIPQIYYQIGNDKFNNNDISGAVASFNKVIELEPDNAKAYYNLARIYKKNDDMSQFKKNVDKTIELARLQNDTKILEAANIIGRDYYLIKANNARTAKKYSEAVDFAKLTISYDEKNATAYYILSSAYNSLSKWDDAIAAGNEALKYEQDDPQKEAKIYYELGIAYSNKSDKAKACAAYKKAAVGQFQQAAEYQIKQVLKCE